MIASVKMLGRAYLNKHHLVTKLNLNILGTTIYTQTRQMRLYRERTIRAMYWRARSFDAVKFDHNRRNNYQDWNYRSEIFAFSRRLQENLSEDTLRQIFVHPSYVKDLEEKNVEYNLPDVKLQSNATLVDRGVQLVEECVKPYLRYTFPRLPEDGIKSITEYLSSETVLADIAKWIGCKDIILTQEYPPNDETMSKTVLAVVAGIERDLGHDRVQRFVVDIIISYLNDKHLLDDVWSIRNPKQTLNVILANSSLPAYEPRIMFQVGVKTAEPCHVVGLYVNKKLIGSSAGETIAIAEECAALDALERMFDLGDARLPMVYGEASEKIDYKSHAKEHEYINTWRNRINQ